MSRVQTCIVREYIRSRQPHSVTLVEIADALDLHLDVVRKRLWSLKSQRHIFCPQGNSKAFIWNTEHEKAPPIAHFKAMETLQAMQEHCRKLLTGEIEHVMS